MLSRYFRTICTLMAAFAISSPILGAELFVGVASTDVSPEEPASLAGQNHLRISKGIESPLTTNVVVVESRNGEESLDLAIMVSCDIAIIPADLLTLVREEVSKQLPDLDTAKIFLFATHTHTAPEVRLASGNSRKKESFRLMSIAISSQRRRPTRSSKPGKAGRRVASHGG